MALSQVITRAAPLWKGKEGCTCGWIPDQRYQIPQSQDVKILLPAAASAAAATPFMNCRLPFIDQFVVRFVG